MNALLMSALCRYTRRWQGIANLPNRSVFHLRIFRDIVQSPGSFVRFDCPSGDGTPSRCWFSSRPVDGGLS